MIRELPRSMGFGFFAFVLYVYGRPRALDFIRLFCVEKFSDLDFNSLLVNKHMGPMHLFREGLKYPLIFDALTA